MMAIAARWKSTWPSKKRRRPWLRSWCSTVTTSLTQALPRLSLVFSRIASWGICTILWMSLDMRATQRYLNCSQYHSPTNWKASVCPTSRQLARPWKCSRIIPDRLKWELKNWNKWWLRSLPRICFQISQVSYMSSLRVSVRQNHFLCLCSPTCHSAWKLSKTS